jgi:hypothetical protein
MRWSRMTSAMCLSFRGKQEMKVRTLGKKENPAIVMIPGMFCTSDMLEIVAKYLAD